MTSTDQTTTEEKVRILFLDDEKSVLNALKRSLRKEGYKITLTSEPQEALRIIGEENIEIVVSDHLMPEMTGIEFFALASRLHPNVVRIMLTGQADVDLAIQAINEGQVHRFLTKPWDDGQLKFILRDAAREVEVRRRVSAKEMKKTETLEDRHPTIRRDSTGAIIIEAA